jgi:hypothetical protein
MDQQQIERGVESIIRQFGDDWGIGLEMIYDRRELATPSLKDVPYEQMGRLSTP